MVAVRHIFLCRSISSVLHSSCNPCFPCVPLAVVSSGFNVSSINPPYCIPLHRPPPCLVARPHTQAQAFPPRAWQWTRHERQESAFASCGAVGAGSWSAQQVAAGRVPYHPGSVQDAQLRVGRRLDCGLRAGALSEFQGPRRLPEGIVGYWATHGEWCLKQGHGVLCGEEPSTPSLRHYSPFRFSPPCYFFFISDACLLMLPRPSCFSRFDCRAGGRQGVANAPGGNLAYRIEGRAVIQTAGSYTLCTTSHDGYAFSKNHRLCDFSCSPMLLLNVT